MVLAVMARGVVGHGRGAEAAGAREYLTKPLDVARFRAVVDNLLSRVPSQS